MSKKVLILPGDGVWPEVIESAVSILNTVTQNLELTYGDIGVTAYKKTEQYLPSETMSLAIDSDAIISGSVLERPTDKNFKNPIRALKKQLNLYTVLRKFFPLREGLGKSDIDLILITGNPDALINITEIENLDGVISEKFISSNSCKRLFEKTANIAEMKNRKKITCAHRSGVYPLADSMFRDIFYKEFAASEFTINDMEVEVLASELIMSPSSMDVIVSTDLYGAAIAGMSAGMVGGSYLTPSGSIGESIGLFEPMNGPKIEIASPGMVNPTSTILSSAMALDHCNMPLEAEIIRRSVRSVYSSNDVTPDVGGLLNTAEFTKCVISAIKKNL